MQYLKTGQKYYLADMGLRNLIIGSRTNDLGHILENTIYLELLRRGYEVYIGKTERAEIDNDPVIMHNGIKQVYALDWLLQGKT